MADGRHKSTWYFDALPCRPQPFADECLSGYLLRLAAANGHPVCKDFIFQMFPGWRFGPQVRVLRWEYPTDDWGQIPHYTQLPRAALQKLTLWPWVAKFRIPPMWTPSRRITPGSILRNLVAPDLRVCPLCLQEQPYIRLMWRLAPVQVCLRHRCALQSHCPNCESQLTPISWQHRHLHCAACGSDWQGMPITAVSHALLAQEEKQQRDFAFLLNPDVSLVNGDEAAALNLAIPEQLPQAVGLKCRYLRVQKGETMEQMSQYLASSKGKPGRLERGNRVSLPVYLDYLAGLDCSWSEFADLTVPLEFIANQPAHLDIRLCPQPDCPNHQLPPSTGVRLARDNVKSRTVGLVCTACGCQFVRRYTGELVPAAPRRSPIMPDNKRRLTKPTAEVALLLEMGFQGCTNRAIAQRLGWQVETVARYWYALDVAEAVHQAQKQRRQEKRQKRLADLQARVDTILAVLCQQEEPITLSAVSQALGFHAACLKHYDEIAQHVLAVAAEHNRQCKQRRTAALRARLEAIIADLPNQAERVTMAKMAADLGVTSAHLRQYYPELAALARAAAQEQLTWLREEKRRQRCVRVQQVVASLVAQGERLIIKRVRQEAGITPRIYQSDTVVRELIQQSVLDPASEA
mgnify:CR=1 FL=1